MRLNKNQFVSDVAQATIALSASYLKDKIQLKIQLIRTNIWISKQKPINIAYN